MSNRDSVEAKFTVVSLNAHYVQPKDNSPDLQGGPPEYDPNYVSITLMPVEKALKGEFGSFAAKTEDVRRLGLTIGDAVTLTLTRR